jgi:hypothetical protein
MATRKTRRSVRRAAMRRPITRTSTRRASNGGSQWSREEIAFMRKYYRNNETSWVAKQLGRTVYSVRYKACDLSIRKARPSVWRGNTGATRPTPHRNMRTRTAWKASSRRTMRTARRSQSRRRPVRRIARKRR